MRYSDSIRVNLGQNPSIFSIYLLMAVPGGSVIKNLPASEVDPGSGRFPREGNGYSLQYLCLENPMDTRGASWVTVHRIAKNQA